jgi:site-specific DNA-cytosine methylase
MTEGMAEIWSEDMRKAGIPGIRYLDAESRKAGQGTRNFVVFPGEEQHLTILERNGQKPPAAPAKPRVATYFSGGGTVESALPEHTQVFAAENNPIINKHRNAVHGTEFEPRDVTNIDPQELKAANCDIFHASPVCKNFSTAKTMRGADELDRRSAESVARAIEVATPPVVTIENVPAYAGTALFKHITDALEKKGYNWDIVFHDAADYGAPQSRKRMLLRAVREGELPPLPPKTGGSDWFGAVSDLLHDAPTGTIPPVERQRLNDMIASGKLDPTKPIITMGGSGFGGTWSAANAGGVAPTLKAANEKPRIIMPDGTVKNVTNRMMGRLMGLDDSVPVPEQGTLAKTILGNGVSGHVTRALITPLLERSKP